MKAMPIRLLAATLAAAALLLPDTRGLPGPRQKRSAKVTKGGRRRRKAAKAARRRNRG